MGFFTTKKEVKLEDFCTDFYQNILSGVFQGVDVSKFKEFIMQVFPEFSKIDSNKLKEEFTILRFELFALAWQDSFNEDLLIAQSFFTMHFLKGNGKQDTWDRMQRYNGAIAAGIRKAICVSQRDNETLDSERLNIKKKYIEKVKIHGINLEERENPDVVIDFINRIGSRIKSNKAWKNGEGMIPYCLSLTLLRILGYSDTELDKITDNQQISTHLMTLMKNFYNEAKESWGDVKIIN